MTSPRSSYGGGYYSAPSFPDTPIYDSLVAERGTPQIAPIRVPAAYESSSHLPALPSALPALPAGPTPAAAPPQYGGYAPAPQQAPMQQQPSPYGQQQPAPPRGYPVGYQQPQRPAPSGTGYEAMRPAAPVRPAAPRPPAPAPAPAPGGYEDPYNRQYRGY
ncbi:hypothetical protein GCM10018793_09340 [Streptomyces sulfonofaciens]|uniref:Uncharacterized protein n=1 Tax=Streptomyces sulfonofaciens TaxID=68272 RepID=A0A919FVP3_9ACTN|nr:DUF6643 family protein [Streptomyces sulfonofaciens]GHH72405.1 hypothetical protein GCM10018793_09340 [Streptomyces sulfonofaciens]